MPKYYVEMTVSFSGDIEADSEQEAERLAIYDSTVMYDGVDDMRITELDEEDDS